MEALVAIAKEPAADPAITAREDIEVLAAIERTTTATGRRTV
jgi:hypothetical protein